MTRMSARQYSMLGEFLGHTASLEEAQALNQLTLASLLHNKWVKLVNHAIKITPVGREAYYSYGSATILRQNITGALCRYLQPHTPHSRRKRFQLIKRAA